MSAVTKNYSFDKVSEKTVKIVVNVQCGGREDCAGWYIRNGEIIGHVWENQPNYKLPKHALQTANNL